MISKNKAVIKTFKSSKSINKSTITLKAREIQSRSFSSKNINFLKSQSPKNGKKKKLTQLGKKIDFSDFLYGNLIKKVKSRDYNNLSFLSVPKAMRSFSRSPTSSQNPTIKSIKTIEKYIKKKILDMSMKIEKEDLNLSEVENKNNCNVTMPFITNKSIKKFNTESGQESPSQVNKAKIGNQSLFKKVINDISKRDFIKKNKEKIYRKIDRKNIVYDSIDDSDIFYEKEKIGFYILSDNIFALIFDNIIVLCTLFDVIYTPFRMSLTVCFCMNFSKNIKFIYYLIDLMYISDLVFSFFRTQYDEDLKIIKETEIIIKNYIENQFISDFLEAIPIFSILSFLCTNNDDYCVEYFFTFKQILLLFFCYFKQLKLIKIINRKKNSLINKILEIIANKHNIEKTFNVVKWTIFCLYGIYSFISINIFIGHLSYPNWIISTDSQNKNYLSLYITSFYFLMTTVTTVGYGDIVCKSTIEIYFQILFLAVGVCIYSWIISNIGNYIKNQDYAAIKCNKDEGLLEEIRIAYPEMPFKLYHQILQHLKSRKLRQQKCDVNILINSLPYSLRNNLLLTMYKQTTNRLKICKNCPNSDFTIKLLTNFIPLFSKKNGILIHEGELIESIVFVNDGRLALEASIDMNFPENSIYKYLYLTFKDISEIGGNNSYMDSSSTDSHITLHNFMDYKRAESLLDKAINNSNIKSSMISCIDESSLGRQIGKYDYDGNFEEGNYKFINIINILKNESYGSVYMFLDKPSPLSLKVKSKKAELLLLRKFDALSISRVHSNIWKRFQRKAYLNMVSIKNLTIKIIKDYSKNNGIIPIQRKINRKYTTFNEFDNSLNNSKEIGKNSNKSVIKIVSNNNSFEKIKNNKIDKEQNNFEDKEPSIDLAANINKVLNSKKNDNKNENIKLDLDFNVNKESNNELNNEPIKKQSNELSKNSKKVENNQIPNISINRIHSVDQTYNNSNSMSHFSNKPHFFSLKNANIDQFVSGAIETKRKISGFNVACFSNRQKKTINNDQSNCVSFCGLHESKKNSLNSGMFSFGVRTKFSDKKCIVNANEKTENKNDFTYSFNNSPYNQELKFSNVSNSNSQLHINKKGTKSPVKNSASLSSPNEKIQKYKLNSVSKIRLRFIKKLTKKIKLLKRKKNKYKYLSKSLTHDFSEYIKRQTTKTAGTSIKNTKTLDNVDKKEINCDIGIKKNNHISAQNNLINNLSLRNSNKILMEIPKFSSSELSEDISSCTHSKKFDLNEISISSQVNFTYKSKYKNLNVISLGYYAKSKKLRKSVINIISEFLSINKKHKLNSNETNSLNEYDFQVYTDKMWESEKKSNHEIKNDSKNNLKCHNMPNNMKQPNSIHLYKKYKNDEDIKDAVNNYSNNENNYTHTNDRNYNIFVTNSSKNKVESNTNINKLRNMNYLSISPSQNSQQAVYSAYKKKPKNFLIKNSFKQEIYNNTEYEYEHIFINNNRENLKKSHSEKEESNLMKINTINSCLNMNKDKYLVEKKKKIEDEDEPINSKNISKSDDDNENRKRDKS